MIPSSIRNACLIISCIFIVVKAATSQNLLQNGSFENHGKLDCLTCPMWPEKFSAVLPYWRTMNGVYPFICDCHFKDDKASIEQGICPFDKVMPFHGKNMIEMDYSPSCYDHEFKTRGCSSYLGAQLLSALEIGKVYEVSFWIYILPSKDSTYSRQIGFNLYPDVVRNPKGKLFDGSNFLLDTIVYNHWYQAKWILRATCNLKFFVLGVFRGANGPSVNANGNHNRFYIDDVSIKQVVESSDSALYIKPYCTYTQEEKKDLLKEIEGVTCSFDPKDSLLSVQSMRLLDSFAIRAKNYPLTAFTISGNTDNTGTNHLELSKARIKSALDYLENKHKIQAFRFFQIYLGDSNPVASNETENGRKANRRVDIRQTDGVDCVIYRNLLVSVFNGDKNQAFRLLNIWLGIVKDSRKIYALFDPRIDLLKTDERWTLVINKVKASYRTQKKPLLAFSLDSLGKEDQKCRTLSKYIENLNAYLNVVDSTNKRFDVAFLSDSISAFRDEERFQYLKKMIGKGDWPRSTEIGERPAKSAFLILSHCDSTNIAHYLPLIKQRCAEGEAEWMHYAMLHDRLLVMRGLPQRYGTQYKPPRKSGEIPELFPLEDPEKVNQWRQEIGLDPGFK